jgi:predicted GH43/DUF377 family glycosyl hydrolase
MTYTGYSDSGGSPLQASIHLAWSDDLVTWEKYGSNPILAGDGSGSDSNGCTGGYIYYENGTYYLFYIGLTANGYEGGTKTLNVATDTDPTGSWTRYGSNPIISPGSGWYSTAIWHPNVVKVGSTYYLFFNATGTVSAVSTERIGYATATSLTGPWTVNATHVLGPTGTGSDWDGSLVGDPSVFKVGETWFMAYYGKGTAATSRDGIAWTDEASFPTGWTRHSANPVLDIGDSGDFDDALAHKPFIVVTEDGIFHFYTAVSAGDVWSFGLAVSGALREVRPYAGIGEAPYAAQASAVSISDTGSYFDSSSVEDALQELGADVAAIGTSTGTHIHVIGEQQLGTGTVFYLNNIADADSVAAYVGGSRVITFTQSLDTITFTGSQTDPVFDYIAEEA